MLDAEKPLSKKLYLIGVLVIFLAVYIQYFADFGTIVSYLIVYGLPVVVVTVIFGKKILSRAAKNNQIALKLGMGLFGALSLLGLFLSVAALMIISQFYPGVIDLLTRPNPALDLTPSQAWILIGVAFLVIGPAEEYLFRGFVFGGLLNITEGKHWLVLAFASSLMFAAVHAYYAVTYEIASAVPFITITAFGAAMAIAYYWSGGNILIPALIHAVYDATGFLIIAVSFEVGLAARGLFLVVGVVFAIIYLPRKIRINPTSPNQPKEPPKTEELTQPVK